MKIVNKTHYQTRDIRRLALAVAKFEHLTREQIKAKTVVVDYGNYSGRGTLGGMNAALGEFMEGRWVKVTIPKTVRRWRWVDPGHTAEECTLRNGSRSDDNEDGHRHLRKVEEPATVNPANIAHTLAHEFAHNAGVNHRRMGPAYHWKNMDTWAWAKDFPIRVKASALPKPKPAADQRVVVQLQHAQRMKARADTRAKRAATIVKRWTRKVRYYETRLAAVQGKAD